MDYSLFRSDASDALQSLDWFLKNFSLVGEVVPDHLGYRCSSYEEFEEVIRMLRPERKYFYESHVSGRPIAMVRLRTPLVSDSGTVSILEIADQKPDGTQKSGFDHAEFYLSDSPMEPLVQKLLGKVRIEKNRSISRVTYDVILSNGFKLRLEPEPIMQKIVRDEVGI